MRRWQEILTVADSSKLVLGRYRVLREIARSNDIVYEGIDPTMNRRVAIKELQLPRHLSGTMRREKIERFYREAKAAGTLSHPNIVTIYEVGQEGDRHFIAMEYLEGRSLRDVLHMQGALPIREAMDVAIGLCEALSYAHERGIVHRDIKPDNVHLLPTGAIKLTDFGIARISAEPSITSQGQVFGTPSYMSPEQIASHTVDHRTDLFSLGVTLYEILVGRKPFAGDSIITITYNIMNLQPVMPSGLPHGLQAILQRALTKDPAQRYQSASAMATELRAEKYALDVSPPPPPPINRTAQMTFGKGGLTLDTGSLPASGTASPSNGLPAGSLLPSTSSSPSNGTNGLTLSTPFTVPSEPAVNVPSHEYLVPNEGMGRETRRFGVLLVTLLLVLAILGTLLWGVTLAYRSMQGRARDAQAIQLYNAASHARSIGDTAAAQRYVDQANKLLPPTEPGSNPTQAQPNQPTSSNPISNHVTLSASSADTYNQQGNQLWSQRDWQGALQAWENAVTAAPTSPAAAQARSNATRVYGSLADQAAKTENYVLARQYWQKIIAINPGSSDAQQAQRAIDTTPATGGSAPGSSIDSGNLGVGNSGTGNTGTGTDLGTGNLDGSNGLGNTGLGSSGLGSGR